MEKQIERIKEKEKALEKLEELNNKLADIVKELKSYKKDYDKVSDYYGSEEYMKDIEADSNNKLPEDLKRAILSEDEAYNALGETYYQMLDIMEIAFKYIKH